MRTAGRRMWHSSAEVGESGGPQSRVRRPGPILGYIVAEVIDTRYVARTGIDRIMSAYQRLRAAFSGPAVTCADKVCCIDVGRAGRSGGAGIVSVAFVIIE